MKEENRKKLNAGKYNDQELYMELENVRLKNELSDEEYIALEWYYNLSSKGTKPMLPNGFDATTSYGKIRKYLVKYEGIMIPNLKATQKVQKQQYVYGLYDTLESKGLLSRIPDMKYTNAHTGYTETRRLYEFTEKGLDTSLPESEEKKDDTYLNTVTIQPLFNIF